jgi:hypothetical protein
MDRQHAARLVDTLLSQLSIRRGFDAWWQSIDKPLREDLKNELVLQVEQVGLPVEVKRIVGYAERIVDASSTGDVLDHIPHLAEAVEAYRTGKVG